MKDKVKSIWDRVKGTIAVLGVGFILGIPAVAGFLGVQVVESDQEGVVCFQAENEVNSLDDILVDETQDATTTEGQQ